MKTHRAYPRAGATGFTLIELIGVLAIMAILAAVVVPNALRALDRAAINSEKQTLSNLSDQVKLYLQKTGTSPLVASWTTAVGSYADMSPTDVATNKRNVARVYVTDPATSPTQRVLLLSSMRAALILPTAAAITTALQFQTIWQTADGTVPAASSWAGWSAWSSVANSGDFLVMYRVNLLPTYNSALQNLTIILDNPGSAGATTSYNIVLADGTVQSVVNVPRNTIVTLTTMHPQQRINLYSASGGASLNYSYVLSTTGKTFAFDGSNWTPQ